MNEIASMQARIPEPYRYWDEELMTPGCNSRDETDRQLAGYWRMQSAKTKPDYPVAIWLDGDKQVVKIGRKETLLQEGTDGWWEFIGAGWTKCIAVTEEAYEAAMSSGFWADGKPCRAMSDAEKMGLEIPTTPAEQGGNNPPSFEVLQQQIEGLAEQVAQFTSVESQDAATRLKTLNDKLKTLEDVSDAERVREKRPHDDAAKAVQAKWSPLVTQASEARKHGIRLLNAYLANEQTKADRLAREQQEKLEAEAAANSEAFAFVPKVEAQKISVGSAFGRNTSVRMKTVAVVTDQAALVQHLLATNDEDFAAYLQSRADKAARAKVALPGVESRKVPA